jgi:sec-independent protein translocase protein TatA
MGLENPLHILILLLVVLLVFGAKRLPELGRSLGDGMRGFRESLQGESPATSAIAQAPAVGVELQTATAEVPSPPR